MKGVCPLVCMYPVSVPWSHRIGLLSFRRNTHAHARLRASLCHVCCARPGRPDVAHTSRRAQPQARHTPRAARATQPARVFRMPKDFLNDELLPAEGPTGPSAVSPLRFYCLVVATMLAGLQGAWWNSWGPIAEAVVSVAALARPRTCTSTSDRTSQCTRAHFRMAAHHTAQIAAWTSSQTPLIETAPISRLHRSPFTAGTTRRSRC